MTSGALILEWARSLAIACGHFWAISLIVKVKLRQILLNLVKNAFAFLEINPSGHQNHNIIQWCFPKRQDIIFNIFFLSDSPLAPYKAVTKHLQKAAEGDEVLLTCQSEGYPESSVTWQDGHQRGIDPIRPTTAVSTPEQLFKVTSQILVPSSEKSNYTCSFTNDGYSATFHIPGESLLLRLYLKIFNWRGDASRRGSSLVNSHKTQTMIKE